MSVSTAVTGRDRTPTTGAIVAVLSLTGIVVSLMQTLVIPIIPKLPEYLNAPASDTAWVITATLLAAAVATPMVGRLGDMFGKRRLLLISVVVMIIGSVVGALSTSVLHMIVGRSCRVWRPVSSRWASASCVTFCRGRSSPARSR